MSLSPPLKARRQSVTRHPFRPEEDALLIRLLQRNPFGSWDSVAQEFENRTARQCRERWLNYVCPQVRIGPWSPQEDAFLVEMVNCSGRSWSAISRMFHGRSENDIKNRWYSHLQHAVVLVGSRWVLSRNRMLEMQTDRRRRRKGQPKRIAMEVMGKRSAEIAGPQGRSCGSETSQGSEMEGIGANEPLNWNPLGGMEAEGNWSGLCSDVFETNELGEID